MIESGTEAASDVRRPVRIAQIGVVLAFRDREELFRALRHRYVLASFLGLLAASVLVMQMLGLAGQGERILLPAAVLGAASLLAVVWAYLALAVRLVAPGRRIWLTPALLGGVGVMVMVAHGVQGLVLPQARAWPGPFLWLVLIALAEGGAALLLRGPVRRAVERMRSFAPEAEEPVVEPIAEPPEPPGEALSVLQAGGVRIPVDRVFRLEASGNYVMVHWQGGAHLVPGPFAEVSARMPAGLGQRVHRSHWVAGRMVHEVRRSGRRMWLELVCKTQVPVGVSLQEEVAGWLEGLGLEPGRGGGGRSLP